MGHEKAFIYGLVDPRDRQIYYIGHTANLDSRLVGHINDVADTPKTQWITTLKTLGVQPIMVVLDVVEYRNRHREEYRWIYLGRNRNWPLTNTSAMKTEKYNKMAVDINSKVFVETKPLFSWGLMAAYLKDILWDDSKFVEYIEIRLGLITLPLFGLLIGVLLAGTSNIVIMVSDGDTVLFESAMMIGEIIMIASSVLSLLVVGPLYARRKAKEIVDVWHQLNITAWCFFMLYKTGHPLKSSDFVVGSDGSYYIRGSNNGQQSTNR